MSDTLPFNGKSALITGASRGIGAAIAKRLASDGASVAITYSSSPQKADQVVQSIEKSGGRAIAIQADSANPASVRDAVLQTVKSFSQLDILVNNAGIAVIAPLNDFSLEDFDRMLAINVKGLFVATQEAVRHMKSGARIINIGSVNADRMPFAGGSVYAMTKAAVAGLTRGLARDLGPLGITVNTIQPGPVETDMNPADGPFAETLKSFLAVKRYAKGSEIAAMVAYLAGPDSSFITGSCLTIDGGFAA